MNTGILLTGCTIVVFLGVLLMCVAIEEWMDR
jgi:hypothetical protein